MNRKTKTLDTSWRERGEHWEASPQELDQYGYPKDWPKCPGCGLPALDGHITCGKVGCDEAGRR